MFDTMEDASEERGKFWMCLRIKENESLEREEGVRGRARIMIRITSSRRYVRHPRSLIYIHLQFRWNFQYYKFNFFSCSVLPWKMFRMSAKQKQKILSNSFIMRTDASTFFHLCSGSRFLARLNNIKFSVPRTPSQKEAGWWKHLYLLAYLLVNLFTNSF